MAKKKKIIEVGKCALCKMDDVELRESHIIPKLVYRRVQEYPNSRFRNLYKIKDIFQDGEKKPMLCQGCELFFNKFETPYTNKVLDPYLKKEELKELSNDTLNNFINSINWRIIYDDLYNVESFKGTTLRSTFEGIEDLLLNHLNEVRTGVTSSGNIKCFTNSVFAIDDFKFKLPVKELFSSMTFGYCCASKYGNYYILTYFLGIVFVTEFKPSLYVDGGGMIRSIFNHFKRSNIKSRVKEELLYTAQCAASQMKENDENMSGILRQQIKTRYSKVSNKL